MLIQMDSMIDIASLIYWPVDRQGRFALPVKGDESQTKHIQSHRQIRGPSHELC